MIGETEITRMGTGGYSLGFELKDIFIEDNRNSPVWFPKDYVVGMLDTLESYDVVDGMGGKVDDLYKRIATENNAILRQRGAEFKLIKGGTRAQILKVRYQAVNERNSPESLEVVFQDYVEMKRPRYLLCERKVTDTFRGVQEFGSGVL
jgi:hypothetical protein